MERVVLQQRAAGLLRQFKIVAILGPRQAGKVTLARQIAAATTDFSPERNFFDQEDSVHLERLADRPELPARFLIVGSASRNLLQPGSETRAGRIAFLEVTPFALGETGTIEFEKLRVRGGFPLSFLAATDAGSVPWREFHIRTFLERDFPALGIQIPAGALRRFWMMLAHCHAQVFNGSDLGRSLSVADTTVRRYLDVLVGTLVVRRLTPWFENIGK